MSVTKTFQELGLPNHLLTTITQLGYESPSPVQAQSIPAMLEGRDVIALAQTGTGKTAGFALPILAHIDLKKVQPQALIIAPTRELAIQVAEALQSYAKHLPGFHVLPIYGGSQYESQIKALKRGVHVVVGTPGRIMDHMRRKTLSLNSLNTLVLDEADEMLKMGFIDDVKWILEQIPHDHQTALFSATMPPSIQRIAQDHLKNPVKIHIEPGKKTVAAIQQSAIIVNREHKLEVLTRFLEVEQFEAAIIFVRTKIETIELAEKIEARGYAVAALNGDIAQNLREKVIERVKKGSIDIVVATEVAARGLDVERMSYVINYDIPSDPESYVHRIGRTGRAGRQGKALMFVTPRERFALKAIERMIGQSIQLVEPPSAEKVSQKRTEQFMDKILQAMTNIHFEEYQDLIDQITNQHNCTPRDAAAALACLMQKGKSLKVKEIRGQQQNDDHKRSRDRDRGDRDRGHRGWSNVDRPKRHHDDKPRSKREDRPASDKPRRERDEKRFDSDKPKRDRDEKHFASDKPKRDRDEKRFDSDKPKRDRFKDKPASDSKKKSEPRAEKKKDRKKSY